MPNFPRKTLEVIITVKPCPLLQHDIDCHPLPPPPPPPPHHHHPLQPLLVVLLCTLAASISFLSYVAIVKACRALNKRSRTRTRTNGSIVNTNETHRDFVDQEHGSVVFHPIWLINTIGLDRSVIESIGFFRYKKGNGSDSDCAVCLGEFQDEESVRILPRCNHTFHVACIDTWLRSHKNCPVCRAPILNTTVTNAETEPNPIGPNAQGENPVGDSGNETENTRETDANCEGLEKGCLFGGVRVQSDLMDGRRRRDRQELETIRRSVSMVQLAGVNNGDRESKKENVLEKSRKCGQNRSFGNRGDVKPQSL